MDQGGYLYPSTQPYTLTHSYLPCNEITSLRLGMPYGCFFRPLIAIDSQSDLVPNYCVSGEISKFQLPRCQSCSGYINRLCDINSVRWFCSMCNARNLVSKNTFHPFKIEDFKQFLNRNGCMLDMPAKFRELDGAPPEFEGQNRIAIEQRPFVHIFLIQESMEYECLLTIINGIQETINSLHPDIQVVLITFSNKINIYRFHGDHSSIHCINILHKIENTLLDNVSTQIIDSNYIELLTPIGAVCSIKQVAQPIGMCRNGLRSALNSILDRPFLGDPMDSKSACIVFEHVMKGINQWLLQDPSDYLHSQHIEYKTRQYDDITEFSQMFGDGDRLHAKSTDQSNNSLFYNISNVLSSMSSMILGEDEDLQAVTQSIRSASNDVRSRLNSAMVYAKERQCPLSTYCGAILQLFLAPFADNHDRDHDFNWVDSMANDFSRGSLSCNLWSLVNFDSNSTCNFRYLQSLSKQTGGKISRVVLGVDIAQERSRFHEMLRREFTSDRVTRCVFKLRMSPGLQVVKDGVSGNCFSDTDYQNVYRMCSCDSNSSISFQLMQDPKYSKALKDAMQQAEQVVFQLAFSFDAITNDSTANKWAIDEESCPPTHLRAEFEKLNIDLDSLENSIKAKRKSSLFKFQHQESPLDNTKKLIVVRRLRVITVVAECSSRIPQILESCSASAVSSLIVRGAIRKDSKVFVDILLDWIMSMLTAAVSSGGLPSSDLTKEDMSRLLRKIAHSQPIQDIIRYVFGAIQIVKNTPNMQGSQRIMDEMIHILHHIQSFDPRFCGLILYPHLHPLKLKSSLVFESSVAPETLPLAMQSVVLSPSTSLLLDNFYSLIVYSTISMNTVREVHIEDSLGSYSTPSYPYVNSISTYTSESIALPDSSVAGIPIEKKSELITLSDECIVDKNWLMRDMAIRFSYLPLPGRILVCNAGTQSAEYFTRNLLDDCGISAFIDSVVDGAIRQYFSNPQ